MVLLKQGEDSSQSETWLRYGDGTVEVQKVSVKRGKQRIVCPGT